jgi:hypothetical protein
MGWGRVPGGGAGEGFGRLATTGRGEGGHRSGGAATCVGVQSKENGPSPTETEEFLIYSKEFQKELT